MLPTEWQAIKSPTINKVRFTRNDYDDRGDFSVEYRTGKVYKFKDVPAIFVQRMMNYSDRTFYFDAYIRGHFDSFPYPQKEDGKTYG